MCVFVAVCVLTGCCLHHASCTLSKPNREGGIYMNRVAAGFKPLCDLGES